MRKVDNGEKKKEKQETREKNKTKVESDRLGRLLESSLFVAQNLVFSPLLIVVVPPWFLA